MNLRLIRTEKLPTHRGSLSVDFMEMSWQLLRQKKILEDSGNTSETAFIHLRSRLPLSRPKNHPTLRQWQVHTRATEPGWRDNTRWLFTYFIIMYILILIRIYCSIFGRAVSGGSHYPTETQSHKAYLCLYPYLYLWDTLRWDGMGRDELDPRLCPPTTMQPSQLLCSFPQTMKSDSEGGWRMGMEVERLGGLRPVGGGRQKQRFMLSIALLN